MEKTLKADVQVQSVEQDAIVTFIPSFDETEKKHLKIKQAVLSLKLNGLKACTQEIGLNETQTNRTIHKVYFENPQNGLEIIDCFESVGLDSQICIDITDELIDTLKFKYEDLKIRIENYAESLTSDVEGQVIILYENSRKNVSENSYQDFDVKKAGSGKLNLSNGKFRFSHADTKENGIMPLNVSHIYNSHLANLEGDEVSKKDFCQSFNSYNLGRGWKLNFQQYLIKNKPQDVLLEDGETAGLFTYICADGNIEEFKEKFYYLKDNEKVYIMPSKIHFSQDGKMTYSIGEGEKYEVFSKIETDSGLSLQTEIEGFAGLSLVQTEIDEIENVKTELKNIEQTLKECKENKNQYKYSLDQIGELEDSTAENYNKSLLSLNLQKESLLAEKDSIKKEYLLKENQYTNNDKTKVYQDRSAEKGDQDLRIVHNEMARASYELQKQSLDNLYNETNGTLKARKEINEKNLNLLNMNIVQTKADLIKQKETLSNNIDLLLARIEEYSNLKQKKEYELKVLKLQVPACLISSANGKLLGFGKTDDENVYRLVLVADSYENAIMLKYDEFGKLKSLENTDKKAVSFNYREDELLSEIIDAKNRKTKFEYDENKCLTKIVYPDKMCSEYAYDENGFLVYACDPSGCGVKLDYLGSTLTKITQISAVSKVSHNEVKHIKVGDLELFGRQFKMLGGLDIDYYDHRSTTITDIKTDKKLTYIFDANGKPITIYENKFDDGNIVGNVWVKSFERDGNKKAFSIEPKFGCEDLLTGASIVKSEAKNISDFYLGETTLCGSGIYLSSRSVSTSIDEVQELSEKLAKENILELVLCDEMIDKINSGTATDFVLSGWAKADSAWASRRLTDYCKNGDCEDISDESELDRLLKQSSDNLKDSRRFELRAEITFKNRTTNETTRTVCQACSYDYLNTNWQYCALPVCIEPTEDESVASVKAIFDYSYNTGTAKIFKIMLQEGKWQYKEFDESGNVAYNENSESDIITTYEYSSDNLLETETIHHNGKTFDTKYYYNKSKSLIRSVDYNGLVSEKEYNDKGQVIKSYAYHKDEPANKLYSEELVLGDNGRKTHSVNDLGDKVSELSYDTQGNVSLVTDDKGETVAYGYSSDDETLLQTSATVDGETNSNTFGYTFDYLTKLSHNGFDIDYEYDANGRQTKVSIAGQDYVSTSFEDITQSQLQENGTTKEIVVGEIQTSEYANGDTIQTTFDSNGNSTKILFNNDLVVQNFYDTNGKLTKTTDSSNETAVDYVYEYDNQGREVGLSYVQNGVSVELGKQLDKNGNVTASSFKLGDAVKTTAYEFSDDPQPRLKGITLSNGKKESVVYDKLGRVKETALGDTYHKNFSYLQKGDHTTEKVSAEWFNINGKNDNFKYVYDSKGNITKVVENGSEIVRYTYDSLSRLIREDNKKLDTTTTFAYDIGGNIVDKVIYKYTLICDEKLEGGERVNYVYSSEGWKDQLVSFNGQDFKYDSLGNPEIYRGKSLVWDKLRTLKSFSDIATFKYNSNGIRISKTTSEGTTHYFTEGSRILAQDNGNLLFFHYGAEGIVGFTYDGVGEFFYKKNVLGDIIGILDSDGSEIVRYIYDAWGNHKALILSKLHEPIAIDKILEYSENRASDEIIYLQNNAVIANINPFRYRGYYYDTETGLYYLNSRYYDPEVGRFINADSLEYLDPKSLNGLNIYAYCLDNPINFVDYTGTSLLAIFLTLFITAVVGGIVGGIMSYENGSRGLDLVGGILLGASIGLAVGGSALMLMSGTVGLIFGFDTLFMGTTALKAFALGAAAFNFTAFLTAPIANITMPGIEFQLPQNYQQNNDFNLPYQVTGSIISKFYILNNLLNHEDILCWYLKGNCPIDVEDILLEWLKK